MFTSWESCLEPAGDPNGVPTLQCIPIVFKNLISAALLFVGIVALFFIMYAGLSFVTAQGDPKKIEGARKTMTFAIIGLVIVLLSFGIILFIGYITGSTACITSFSDMNKFMTGCK